MAIRREFLKLMGWSVGSMLLTSCSGDGDASGAFGAQPQTGQPLRWPIAREVYTTAQQQILSVPVPAGTPPIAPKDVAQYAQYGYSAWEAGRGTLYPQDPNSNPNPRPNPDNPAHDLRTEFAVGYAGKNVARLSRFFTMSDMHLADKESPAQANLMGWNTSYRSPIGSDCIAAWSPVIISTTQVLDAAIQTINALHDSVPFAFGISLGDQSNTCQYNELRWFIDCMDGQVITPSSGVHRGATTVDYQMPFQAYGLNRGIPWYAVVGNHDHCWMGTAYETAQTVAAHVGTQVLELAIQGTFDGILQTRGYYMGVVDGTTTYGTLIDFGAATPGSSPPTVAADSSRRTLESYTTGSDGSVTVTSTTLNFMSEFFRTTSTPVGHGFTQANLDSDVAYYSFQPQSDVPLKVIVLNDNPQTDGAASYAKGALDATQLAWLQNELQQGQDQGLLMMVAAHIPIAPQQSITDPTPTSMWNDPTQEQQVLAILHSYPNFILWLAGHRHGNVITPQPSTSDPTQGFWEVETPSLRDFPQGVRTLEFRRNSDHTLSILVTTVGPAVQLNSPAGASRGYSVGAAQTFGIIPAGTGTSLVYNAELVVSLTPAMQAKIATLGVPL